MNRIQTIAALAATAIVASATPAVATHLIDSGDVRNNTLTSQDVKNGSLAERDLNKALRAKVNAKAVPGPAGPAGADGLDGIDGADGAPGLDGTDGAQGEQGEPGLDGADGERGPQGPQGERGPRGDRGDRGLDGVSGLETRSGQLLVTANDGRHTVGVDCPVGKFAIGGGIRTQSTGGISIQSSYPEAASWVVQFEALAGVEARAYVVCAKAL